MRLAFPPARPLLALPAGALAGCWWLADLTCDPVPFAFDATLDIEDAAALAEDAGGDLAAVPCVEACAELWWSLDPSDITQLDACTVEVVNAGTWDGDTGTAPPESLHVTCSGMAIPGCK